MTSLFVPRKIFKRTAIALLVTVLLVFAILVWIYLSISIKEAPTCANFRASVSASMAYKILPDLQGVIEFAGLRLRPDVKRETYAKGESDQATVDYYSNQESKDYSIFVCSNNRDTKLWQEVAVKVEQVLQRDATTFNVSLQMNDRDFKCNPNCIVDVSLPLDFEKLNRTRLIPKGP